MLKLVFSKYNINQIFLSNKKISKHYNDAMSRFSKTIEEAADDVYSKFQKNSKNLLFSQFNVTKSDIISKLYDLIKKDIIVVAFGTLFKQNEYNLNKAIIRILDNDKLLYSRIIRHQNFLYYYYSLYFIEGKINEKLLDAIENLYLK